MQLFSGTRQPLVELCNTLPKILICLLLSIFSGVGKTSVGKKRLKIFLSSYFLFGYSMRIFITLGSLLGASSLNFLKFLPKMTEIIIFDFIALFSIAFCLVFVNKPVLRFLLKMLLVAIFAFSWSCFHASKRLAWQLPKADQNQFIEIQGNVDGLSLLSQEGLRFTLKVDKYKTLKLSTPIKIRLFWPNATQIVKSGDRMHCQVQLKSPWHLANPGRTDQEKTLFIEGVRATGKILKIINYQTTSKFSLDRLRQNLQQKIADQLKDKPFLGVIQALTLGINSNITSNQWKIFQNTGTAHIVAISGAHIGLVAILCMNLVRRFTTRYVRLTTFLPAKCYGAMIAMLSAIIYSALAGFSIPTERACAMILVSMLAILQRQPILSWQALALSWIVVYIMDPLAPLQKGFWLSFGCVAALILGRSYYTGNRWRQWFMPQWIVFIGLFPLSLLFFQQVPLFSCIANLIVLPVMSFIIIPFSLIGLLFISIFSPLSYWCLEIAHCSIAILWPILEYISQMPYSVWIQGKPLFTHFIIATISAILLLAPKGLYKRSIVCFGFLPMMFFNGPIIKKGECRFTLLDVGQGLAAVIQTKNHTLLYDAGPQYGKDSDAGSRVIDPFLRTSRIKKLDKVIISHGDLDHRAGLKGLKNFPMIDIITSEPNRLEIPSRNCLAGETWEWDGVTFKILSPLITTSKNRNDLSCVLQISTKAHHLLLTGDIEHTAEKRLLSSSSILKSDILVVPHHGSLTSSTQEFLASVSPKYALYPVGIDNRYGFPKQKILQRYQKLSANNLLVSETGALIFDLRTNGKLMAPIQWREVSRHFWNTEI